MRKPIDKVVAHPALNFREADLKWDEFCRENSNLIVDVNRYDFFRTRLMNGEVHYFVPACKWNEWTRGRTYWRYGELWHSDCKLKETGSGEL